MTKLDTTVSSPQLVQVSGYQRYFDGTPDLREFSISSENSATAGDSIYPRGTLSVKPNAQGFFKVDLLPSAVVGTYTLQLPERALYFRVPDNPSQVALSDCLI